MPKLFSRPNYEKGTCDCNLKKKTQKNTYKNNILLLKNFYNSLIFNYLIISLANSHFYFGLL